MTGLSGAGRVQEAAAEQLLRSTAAFVKATEAVAARAQRMVEDFIAAFAPIHAAIRRGLGYSEPPVRPVSPTEVAFSRLHNDRIDRITRLDAALLGNGEQQQ